MSVPEGSVPEERTALLLWGFMGSGKSSAGRRLADSKGVAFCDLDERVALEAGCGVAEIFAREGEVGFRAREKRALAAVLDEAARSDEPIVVALGGGALLDPELRRRALAEAFVVVLEAPVATLAARTRGSDRPLLQGGDAGRMRRLLQERAAAYAEAHARIDTGGVGVEEVVKRLDAVWKR